MLITAAFAATMAAIITLTIGDIRMGNQLAALTAAVARTADVEASAVVLIQGLAAQIQAAAGDPLAVAALAAQLTASADALAAAVTAAPPPAV